MLDVGRRKAERRAHCGQLLLTVSASLSLSAHWHVTSHQSLTVSDVRTKTTLQGQGELEARRLWFLGGAVSLYAPSRGLKSAVSSPSVLVDDAVDFRWALLQSTKLCVMSPPDKLGILLQGQKDTFAATVSTLQGRAVPKGMEPLSLCLWSSLYSQPVRHLKYCILTTRSQSSIFFFTLLTKLSCLQC